jgi:hypothetical protein
VYLAAYHCLFMLPARFHHSIPRSLFPAILAFTFLFGAVSPSRAQQSTETLPLSEVHPGMQGYAYTIFAGDQIEKFDLEVLGIMPNFLGPKQSIILVQLKGPKVEHTGVVAGMSGSPWHIHQGTHRWRNTHRRCFESSSPIKRDTTRAVLSKSTSATLTVFLAKRTVFQFGE